MSALPVPIQEVSVRFIYLIFLSPRSSVIDSSVDFNCFNQQSFSSAVSQNLDSGSGDPAHDCTGTLRPEAGSAQQADAKLCKGDKMSPSVCRRPTSLSPWYLPHALKLCLIAARWPGLLRSQRPRRQFGERRAQELFLLVRSQSQPSNNEPIDAHVKIGLGHPSNPSKVSLVSPSPGPECSRLR